MTALIITGGNCPSAENLRKLSLMADTTIAADSGVDAALSAGIDVDISVGDFDSIADSSVLDRLPSASVKKYDSFKDLTDTELAIEEARAMGAMRILLAGGGGGRLDHTLAIAAIFRRPMPPDEWHTSIEAAFFVKAGTRVVFKAAADSLVSIFPLGQASAGMRSYGLRWDLAPLTWGPGDFGISNRNSQEEFSILAGTCSLLVVLPVGGERVS